MQRSRFYILVILFAITVLVWSFYFSRKQSDVLTVAFLDVGQGDATFIESPSGAQVLIDGGSGRSVLRGLGKQMGFFDRTLDVVIATHPDKDHIGGLPDVLESYRVSYILEPGVVHDTATYDTFIELSEDEPDSEYLFARRGQVIDLGGGVYLRILFPDRDVSYIDSNDGSVIAQLVYGETEVLLTADAPSGIEQYVVFLDSDTLESDVLKVGHHGSDTSSSEFFVGWASPTYAVISRGCDNRYGHPDESVLETLNRFEIEIFDTCENGTVVFESDGSRVTLK